MTSKQNPGCIAFFFNLFGGGKEEAAPPGELPYRVRDDFLSAAELSFHHVLSSVIGARAVICPKVGLADLLFVAQPNRNLGYRNRIALKHIDWLVCAPATMTPLFAVELDDSSHARADREARDEFLDEALRAAGLPLLRFPAQRQYNTQEVAARVEPLFAGEAEMPAEAAPPAAEGVAPICPKCGVPMVLRTATRGPHQGTQFYGCPNYPRCRETREA